MRPIWKGNITFGLVTIPIGLYNATRSEKLQFRMLHEKDHSPVSFKRFCQAEEKEIPYNEIVKGYEYEKDEYVVLTDEDFQRVDVEATQTVEIEEFVDLEDIDPIFFEQPYYLEPAGKAARKPYVLLRRALAETGKVGIAKVVLRTREHLAAVRAEGDLIVVNLMRFADEIADASELNIPGGDEIEIREKELKLGIDLIQSMAEEWDPTRYEDEYRTKLLQIIQEKLEGREIEMPAPAAAPSDGRVIDLMEVLKRSLEEREKEGAKKVRQKAG